MYPAKANQDVSIRSGLVLVFCITLGGFLSSGCSSGAGSPPTPAPPVRILEIRSDAKGMFDVIGKSLHFRLTSDGTAEFEVPDDAKKRSGISNTAEVNTLKRVILDEREQRSLKEAIEALGGSQLESRYQRKCCCTDTQLDLSLSVDVGGAERSVVVAGYCDTSDVVNTQGDAGRQLPPSLIGLLNVVDGLRWKYNKGVSG